MTYQPHHDLYPLWIVACVRTLQFVDLQSVSSDVFAVMDWNKPFRILLFCLHFFYDSAPPPLYHSLLVLHYTWGIFLDPQCVVLLDNHSWDTLVIEWAPTVDSYYNCVEGLATFLLSHDQFFPSHHNTMAVQLGQHIYNRQITIFSYKQNSTI